MNLPLILEAWSAVWSVSWRAAWLIVLLVLLRRAVRGRVPAQVWFVVWLVVAARLLLPFSVPAAWSPYNLAPTLPRAAVVATPPEIEKPAMVVESTESAAPVSEVVVQSAAKAVPIAATSVAPAVTRVRWSREEWLAVIWLAGVVTVGAWRVAGLVNFQRRFRADRTPAGRKIWAVVSREATLLGGTSEPQAWETSAVDTPALYGLWRPCLLLPRGLVARLTPEELRHVVRHELGHWRRRDLAAQALLQVALTVHWFNPLVWFAARLARADCEHACDEYVLRREAAGTTHDYGATLLKVLGMVGGRRRSGPVVAMLEGKEQLTERIRRIAGFRAVTSSRVVIGAILIALVAVAGLTREALAQATEPKATAKAYSTPAIVTENTIEEQRQLVDRASAELYDFKQRNRVVSFDERRDTINAALRAANAELLHAVTAQNNLEIRCRQIEEARAKKVDLSTLPYFNNRPGIESLRARLVDMEMEQRRLAERYLEKHPKMTDMAQAITLVHEQLDRLVESTARQITQEYLDAKEQAEVARHAVEQRESEALALDRLDQEYRARERELRTRELMLQNAVQRLGGAAPAPAKSAPTEFSVSVLGEVNRQGAISFGGGGHPTLLDAIAQAGGFTNLSDGKRVRVRRTDPATQSPTVVVVNVMRLLDDTQTTATTESRDALILQPGDVVYVPEKVL